MTHRCRFTLSVAVVFGCLIPIGSSAADKPAPGPVEPKFWKETPDHATVVAATFVGGPGHEWLVSGGFQADGTVVIVGNVARPALDVGVPVRPIGADLPAPPPAERVASLVKGRKGMEPRIDKDGKPVFEKPSWRHAGVTGFVVRASPDLKNVLSAHRLPWASGAITSAAVGSDGSIYVAGRATDQIAKMGGSFGELQPAGLGGAATREQARCDQAFIAKLTPDAAKTQWVRRSRWPSDALQVTARADGTIRFAARDVVTLDAEGRALTTIAVPGGVTKTTSISPIDGSVVVAGEHHSPTGREPWRCPTLNVYCPEGALLQRAVPGGDAAGIAVHAGVAWPAADARRADDRHEGQGAVENDRIQRRKGDA